MFNTILLAIEGPANILPEETLLLMVAADTVLTVGYEQPRCLAYRATRT